ncbi:MAG: Unknown protein [uncultured Thiotrichaceae bacterium]|uniref:DUF11 domain-containing protein n=1 Tax=uncultured Thiotrichaceae bacterium TaxID=298394 RepID=A0A6S6TAC0_9GAMM|nr:MAG: Unknown protein [uncultured Thiotrichaceae bacterium]
MFRANITYLSSKSFKLAKAVNILWLVLVCGILLFTLLGNNSKAATPPETLITNTVTASFLFDGKTTSISSSAGLTTASRTPSIISFHKITDSGTPVSLPEAAYNSSDDGGKAFNPISELVLSNGTVIAVPDNHPIEETSLYVANEPIIIQVEDLDQNSDPLVRETIFVTIIVPETGDTEVILLTETEPSSGIFRGAIQSASGSTANPFDGIITVQKDAKIRVNYQDDIDSTDISATAALIDPSQFITLSKNADKETAAIGDIVKYTLSINTTGLENNLLNLRIHDRLPPGFRYVDNTARLDDVQFDDTQIIKQGRQLTFLLGNMPRDNVWKLTYRVLIGAGAPDKEATNIAQAISDNSSSKKAQASIRMVDELMQETSILTGRVFIGCAKDAPALEKARIYLETGRSTQSDEDGFWHLEGVKPGNHVITMDPESLPEGFAPLSCKKNTQFAGSDYSQFVDLKQGSLWRADFYVQGSASTKANYKLSNKNKELEADIDHPLENFGKTFVTTATPGFKILWPPENYVPAVASTDVAVQHSPMQKIEVSLNGKLVNALNYDGSSTNKEKTVRVSRYRGLDIDIKNRENTLKVVLKDKKGKVLKTLFKNIHFSSLPASVEVLEARSNLTADGKSLPEIVIEVKDLEGFPMRKNTHGYFVIEDGDYQIDDQRKKRIDLNLGESFGQHKYYIDETGIARIFLKPTTQTGEITLRFYLDNNRSVLRRVWLKPHIRDTWLLVGLAEGTLGHKTISGNLQTLNDKDIKSDTYSNGRIAFFAKGKVKGKYLLTVAYDSAKEDSDVGTQLQGNIDPEAFYTVYGDRTYSQYEATSSKKLFLKLEKEQFYFLFGDYRTNLTVTELSEYKRTLNGIHSEYHGKYMRSNISVSYTRQKHQQDEIPGDGTSGLYYLSQNIIPNSEVITLETRDRFHPEQIVSQRLLAEHVDYTIDYDQRSLFLKFPVPGRDEKLNPNFIVVDYETDGNSNKTLVAAGRAAYVSEDGFTETGISAIHEEKNANDEGGDLVGVDITHKLNENIELKGEFAQSDTNTKDSAWLLQAKTESKKVTGKAYIRQQGSNFGLGHQNISDQGTKKHGLEADYRLKDDLTLNSDIYRQDNLDNDNRRDQASIELEQRFVSGHVDAGLRYTRELVNTELRGGTLASLGSSFTPGNGRLTFRSHVEKNIRTFDSGDAEAYPDRLIVGADIGITDGVALFLEREIAKGDQTEAVTDRVGLTSKLWEGATARTSIDRESAAYGDSTFGTLGLQQRLSLTEHITADISVDHAKTLKTSEETTNNSVDADQPAIYGAERDNYTAFSVGLGYRDNDWGWTNRLEIRQGDSEDKTNLRFGLLRNLGKGRDISASISITDLQLNNGVTTETTEFSVGSAWHPQDSDYTILQRLDFKQDQQVDNTSKSKTRKFIHNIHINKQIGDKTQASLHHGIKHTIDSEFNQEFENTVDTGRLQVRRNINESWDVGLHAGYLRSWDADTTEYGYGLSVGTSPRKNMWFSLGYNFEGFSDDDFNNSDYTAKGPYIQFRYRADAEQLGLNHDKKQ